MEVGKEKEKNTTISGWEIQRQALDLMDALRCLGGKLTLSPISN